MTIKEITITVSCAKNFNSIGQTVTLQFEDGEEPSTEELTAKRNELIEWCKEGHGQFCPPPVQECPPDDPDFYANLGPEPGAFDYCKPPTNLQDVTYDKTPAHIPTPSQIQTLKRMGYQGNPYELTRKQAWNYINSQGRKL